MFSAAAIAFALVGTMKDVEQTAQGGRPAATLVASFDGLGVGFEGPQGTAALRNPSDNSLAIGPDHVVYIKKDATSYSSRIGAFRMPGCSM